MDINVICTVRNGAVRSLYGATRTREELTAAVLKLGEDLRANGWDFVRTQFHDETPRTEGGAVLLCVHQYRNEQREPLDVEIYGID